MQKLGPGILSTGVILLVAVVLVFFVGVPIIIDGIVEEKIQLKEGTEIWDIWVNLTVPIYFTFRVFNITNPEALQRGEKLHVTEHGPYVFLERRNKTILNVNQDADTITYDEKLTYYFQPHMSNGSLDDEFTLPNIPFITMATIARQTFPLGIPVIPVKLLEEVGEKFYMTNVKVKDFIFDGVEVHELYQLLAPLAPGGAPEEFKGSTFAFLNQKNGTSSGIWKINTGIHDPSTFGQMVSWNGNKELTFWTNESLAKGQHQYCNKLNGSDGTLTPPFVKKDRDLYVYHTLLCRSLKLEYKEETSFEGIDGYKFVIPHNYYDHPDVVPDNRCFCPKPKGGINSHCFKGAYRIFGCHHGAPVVLSLPHFMNGDQKLVDGIGGMAPDPKIHSSFVSMEKHSGALLTASLKFQASIELQPLAGIPSFNDVSSSLVPFLWLDLNAQIDKETQDTIKTMLVKPLQIVEISQWTLIGVTCLVVVIGIVITVKRRNANKEV